MAICLAALFMAALPPAGASPPEPQALDTLLHSTLFGTSSYEMPGVLSTDAAGNLYLAGYTYSADLTTGVANPYDASLNGTTDAFVSKLDPTGSTLLWATYLGGDSYELGYAVAAAPNGTVYVGGRTYSTDFVTTPGASDRNYTGYYGDGFVTAFNATGVLLWSTFLGGASLDEVTALAVGSDGTVYAGGSTLSLDFPATNQVWDGSANGGYDAFLCALAPGDGALRYATYLGGSQDERVTDLAVDAGGRVVLVGTTESDDLPTTAGALQRSLGGGLDAFVTRVNATGGALLYSTYLGGSANETMGGVALHGTGRATLAGSTVSANFPTTAGAFDRSRMAQDAFVAQLASDGSSLVYSTLLGGSGNDSAVDVAVAAGGDVLVTGSTASTADFPTTAEAKFASYRGGATDGFVTRLSADGSALQYSSYFGGSSTDVPGTVLALSVDRALVSGYTASLNFPATQGAYDWTLIGVYDTFASQFKTAYRLGYSTSPAGLSIELDGASRGTPFEVACPFDASFQVSAADVQQQGSTRYVFGSWTGALPRTHVQRCAGDQDVTATYDTQHQWTVDATHAGRTVRVDNVSHEAPYTFWCPQSGGAFVDVVVNQTGNGSRFTFTGWTDGGARAHGLACTGPGTLRAQFAADFAAAVTTDPPGLALTALPAFAGAPGSFWCPEGQAVVIGGAALQEAAGTRYGFAGWDDGAASLPRSFPCTGPVFAVARYVALEHLLDVTTDPPGLAVSIAGNPVLAPYTAWCVAGASLNLSLAPLQERDGVRYGFSAWAGMGEPVGDPTVSPVCDGPLALVAGFAPSAYRMQLATEPAGRDVQVGGDTLVTPGAVWCAAGLPVLVNAPSPQVDGQQRFVFASWSTGRAQAHAAPCDGATTLTATFGEEVLLSIDTLPAGLQVVVDGGQATAPVAHWCPVGGRANVSAPALQQGDRMRFAFDAWSDGATAQRTLDCDGPRSVDAHFTTQFEVRVGSNPPGLRVVVDGLESASAQSFYWAQGSLHTLEFPSPQSDGLQTFVFSSWSDGGERSHTVAPQAPMDLVAAAAAGGLGDFQLVPESPSLQVDRGSSAVVVVGVRKVNEYVGPGVTITVVDAPEGVTARCVPEPVRPGEACALEVKVASSVAPGQYPLTLRASNGTSVRTLQVVLEVSPEGSIEAAGSAALLVPLAVTVLLAAAAAAGLLLSMRLRRSKGEAHGPVHGRDEKD